MLVLKDSTIKEIPEFRYASSGMTLLGRKISVLGVFIFFMI